MLPNCYVGFFNGFLNDNKLRRLSGFCHITYEIFFFLKPIYIYFILWILWISQWCNVQCNFIIVTIIIVMDSVHYDAMKYQQHIKFQMNDLISGLDSRPDIGK